MKRPFCVYLCVWTFSHIASYREETAWCAAAACRDVELVPSLFRQSVSVSFSFLHPSSWNRPWKVPFKDPLFYGDGFSATCCSCCDALTTIKLESICSLTLTGERGVGRPLSKRRSGWSEVTGRGGENLCRRPRPAPPGCGAAWPSGSNPKNEAETSPSWWPWTSSPCESRRSGTERWSRRTWEEGEIKQQVIIYV